MAWAVVPLAGTGVPVCRASFRLTSASRGARGVWIFGGSTASRFLRGDRGFAGFATTPSL
jgi:hypothetical protein